MATLCRYGSVRLAKSFAAATGLPFRQLDWGALERLGEREYAIWLRLDRIPVHEPFHPPSRFSDLARIFLDADRDLVREITDIATSNASQLRDQHGHLLLLGFPIPRRIGEPAERMHWQALRLPALTSPRSLRAFRPGRSAFHELDRAKVLRPSLSLDWIASENWMDDNLTARGALPNEVTSGRTVVIGCGALGSIMAELLVRGGCNDVVLVDHERFEAGNAVRHVLALDSVGNGKAGDLAKRLNLVRPSVRVQTVHEAFPPMRNDSRALVAGACRVVDTTGNDAVIESLSRYGWEPATVLVAVAVGYRARRLFCYSASARAFTSAGFRQAIEPWLALERREPREPFPRPGIGCWSPAFPAGPDDMCLMGAAAVKFVKGACVDPTPRLRVLEQPAEGEELVGLREVMAPPS